MQLNFIRSSSDPESEIYYNNPMSGDSKDDNSDMQNHYYNLDSCSDDASITEKFKAQAAQMCGRMNWNKKILPSLISFAYLNGLEMYTKYLEYKLNTLYNEIHGEISDIQFYCDLMNREKAKSLIEIRIKYLEQINEKSYFQFPVLDLNPVCFYTGRVSLGLYKANFSDHVEFENFNKRIMEIMICGIKNDQRNIHQMKISNYLNLEDLMSTEMLLEKDLVMFKKMIMNHDSFMENFVREVLNMIDSVCIDDLKEFIITCESYYKKRRLEGYYDIKIKYN